MTKTETTKIFAERLGDLIYEAREKNGKKMKDIERETGISDAALSKYQNDAAEAGINAVVKIARYFGVSADWLLGLADNRRPENQDIGQRLGLSDDAIRSLERWKSASLGGVRGKSFHDFLSTLLSSIRFLLLLHQLWVLRNDIGLELAVASSQTIRSEIQLKLDLEREVRKVIGRDVEVLLGQPKIVYATVTTMESLETYLKEVIGFYEYVKKQGEVLATLNTVENGEHNQNPIRHIEDVQGGAGDGEHPEDRA